MWSCCGLWLFGKPNRYRMLIDDGSDYVECPELWKAEIDMGLPPGVKIADLLQNTQNANSLKQAYSLAVQSNKITDYLGRFDSIHIPDSCKAVVSAQISKLKAIRTVIWNTLISMSIGEINIEEEGLQALLDKQAGDNLALMEVEKIAHAIRMDETSNWALDIASIIDTANKSVIGIDMNKDLASSVEMEPIVTQPKSGPSLSSFQKKTQVFSEKDLKSSNAYVNVGFEDDDGNSMPLVVQTKKQLPCFSRDVKTTSTYVNVGYEEDDISTTPDNDLKASKHFAYMACDQDGNADSNTDFDLSNTTEDIIRSNHFKCQTIPGCQTSDNINTGELVEIVSPN